MSHSTTARVSAIPSVYLGVRFRSRLEAHWCAFFDALGTAWEYEPRTFRMKGQRQYTPDFYLPNLGIIVEVKPHPVTDQSLVDKYTSYGPELVRRGACRMFMLAVGSPRPGIRLLGWWAHGERAFTFEPVFGDESVRGACLVADSINPQPYVADKQPSWYLRFADMTLDEVRQDQEFKEYLSQQEREGRVCN